MNFLKNLFKKKEDEIILDCYTYLPYVYETAKINYAYKFIPDWWKNTPKFTSDNTDASIKNCLGLKEYFRKGIVIPSWFGLQLKIHPLNHLEGMTYSYQSSTSYFKDISHSTEQFSLLASNNKVNFKIHSPWLIKSNDTTNFIWSHPLYHLNKFTDSNFDVMPAVVNYKYQHDTHINTIITQEEDTESFIEIEPLTPLVMIHPLSDKKIKFRYHLLSEEEWYQKNSTEYYMFSNTARETSNFYRNKKNLKEKIESIECPHSRNKT